MRRFGFAQLAVVEATAGSVDAWVAQRWQTRLLGLCGLRAIPAGSALLIPRCAWVHTGAMRFALDVVFLEWPPAAARCTVLAVRAGVRPARSVRLRGRSRAATAALEVPAQSAFLGEVQVGDSFTVTCLSSPY
jgi:uncharacterized membrane protein (UPF0127 family)